jgi:hypothetical protein
VQSVTKTSEHFTLPELSTNRGTQPYEHGIHSLIPEKHILPHQQKAAHHVRDSRVLRYQKHEPGLEKYGEVFHQSDFTPGLIKLKDIPLTYEQAKAQFFVSSQDTL